MIEMIVAVGVFSGASLIGVTALLSLMASQRKAISIQSAYDNMRFAVEIISKDLRTGDVFHCGSSGNPSFPQDCPPSGSGDTSITFLNSNGQSIRYQQAVCNSVGCIQKSVDGGANEQITGDDVDIQNLRFFVRGSLPSSGESPPFQAVVTIIADGEAGSGRSKSQFSLQTTVTQRTVRK